RVFGWDDRGKVRAWTMKDGQPTDANNSPLRTARRQTTTSPDGSLRAEAQDNVVALIELANHDLQRDLAERLVLDATNRVSWHQQQAAQAEKEQEWFAAEFHLRQLLKDNPEDDDLKRRHELAVEKSPPPVPMQPLPRP